MPLNYDDLKKLVVGDTVAIRGAATLEPAGGPGDKIFPPTHAVDDKNKKPGAKYAFETRRINGHDATCVLIDSVQSQANRMEEALQALWSERRIALPVVSVDFSSIAPEVGRGDPYLVAGDALAKLGRWEEAEDSYERFIRKNTSSVQAYVKLARVRAKREDEAGSHDAITQGKQTWGVLPSFKRRHEWPWYLAALGSPFWL